MKFLFPRVFFMTSLNFGDSGFSSSLAWGMYSFLIVIRQMKSETQNMSMHTAERRNPYVTFPDLSRFSIAYPSDKDTTIPDKREIISLTEEKLALLRGSTKELPHLKTMAVTK